MSPGADGDPAGKLDRIEGLATLLDTKFVIPGTGIKLGLDSIIGLIPGIGDSASLVASFVVLARLARLGLPAPIIVRMAANILIDALVGTVPLIGDIFDVAYRANVKNTKIARDWLEKNGLA